MASLPLSLLLLCLSCVAAFKSNHVIGTFGYQKFPLDFIFGDGSMIVTIHVPSDAPKFLRSTSNLHIFDTGIVAIRSSEDKTCYIQNFNATEEGMKERVQNALTHGGDLGSIKEEIISVAGLDPLPPTLVKQILGEKISAFCSNHLVYILSHNNYYVVKPQDVQEPVRSKRFAIRDPPARYWPSYKVDVIDIIDGGRPRYPWGGMVVC